MGWLILAVEVTGGLAGLGWAVWHARRYPSWQPGAAGPEPASVTATSPTPEIAGGRVLLAIEAPKAGPLP